MKIFRYFLAFLGGLLLGGGLNMPAQIGFVLILLSFCVDDIMPTKFEDDKDKDVSDIFEPSIGRLQGKLFTENYPPGHKQE